MGGYSQEHLDQMAKEHDEMLAKLPSFEEAGLLQLQKKFISFGYEHNSIQKSLRKSGPNFASYVQLDFADDLMTQVVIRTHYSCSDWKSDFEGSPMQYSCGHTYQLGEWEQIESIDTLLIEPPHERWKKSNNS
jgi:hypothetical protein